MGAFITDHGHFSRVARAPLAVQVHHEFTMDVVVGKVTVLVNGLELRALLQGGEYHMHVEVVAEVAERTVKIEKKNRDRACPNEQYLGTVRRTVL